MTTHIAVFNQKDGVGKTTTALGLGAERIAIIDCGPFLGDLSLNAAVASSGS